MGLHHDSTPRGKGGRRIAANNRKHELEIAGTENATGSSGTSPVSTPAAPAVVDRPTRHRPGSAGSRARRAKWQTYAAGSPCARLRLSTVRRRARSPNRQAPQAFHWPRRDDPLSPTAPLRVPSGLPQPTRPRPPHRSPRRASPHRSRPAAGRTATRSRVDGLCRHQDFLSLSRRSFGCRTEPGGSAGEATDRQTGHARPPDQQVASPRLVSALRLVGAFSRRCHVEHTNVSHDGTRGLSHRCAPL